MAVALLFLLWLPPLVEQLTGHRGNVSRLVAFVSASRGSRAPASRSIDLFAHTYMILFSSGMHMPTGGPAPSAAAPLAVIGATATLIAVIAAAAVARVGRHAFLSAFCLLSAVASLVALASVFFIRGEAADYMVLWIGVIGALSVAATVSVLVAPVRLSLRAQKILSAIAWTIAALLVGVSSVRLAAWQRAAGREREPLRLYDAIASDMTNLHARRAVIRHTASSWEQVVGVVLTGEKRGSHLSVSDDMTRVTGTAYRSRGDEDVEFTIFDPVLDGDVAMALRRARTRRVGWLVVATVPRPR
jgi:hypothetical protein